jgi:LruC domain-containing protein
MKILKLVIFSMLITNIFLFSCSKDIPLTDNNSFKTFKDIVVPKSFSWKTTENVSLGIYTKNTQGEAIPNVIIKVYTDYPNKGGKLMLKGTTNKQGFFNHARLIPSYYTHLVLSTEHIGLIDFVKVPVVNGQVNYTFGGPLTSLKTNTIIDPNTLKSSFSYLGTYDSNGVPNYLENPGDVLNNDFLQDLTNTLAPGASVPIHNPYLLGTNKDHDLKLNCNASVYVTFIHESAGFKNVLGFYTYDLNTPPTSANDISNITIIFPNSSFSGSGGGLQTGDKVKIGTFPANTGIGWVFIADGWVGGAVTDGHYYYYSNKDFNHETAPDLKQHSLLIQDPGRKLMILSFEDLDRENKDIYHCDQDFNDCMFIVSTDNNPCIISDLPVIKYSSTYTDTDKDGIPDIFDDYPNDPEYAFNNYYPCNELYGSLAFEDLWPGKGDYDFNDLVINYNFNQITNSDNHIVRIDGIFKVMAQGADLHNGFGFELPINVTEIQSVGGMKINHTYLNFNLNGTESGHTKAVIIPFDDTYDILPHPGLGIGTNTSPGAPYVNPNTVTVSVKLNNALNYSDLGSPPYNPFIIINKNRGYEVHLPDYAPTALFNTKLFGTFEDDSDPNVGRYYKTEKHYPWAINIMDEFDYPIEKREVTAAYLKFAEWAESGGVLFQDWYEDNVGYRNATHIYDIP